MLTKLFSFQVAVALLLPPRPLSGPRPRVNECIKMQRLLRGGGYGVNGRKELT